MRSSLSSLSSPSSLSLVGAALLLAACGEREEFWDFQSGTPTSHGLASSAVFVDTAAERLLFLTVQKDLTLTPVSVPIRRGVAASSPTRDGSGLLVLARGDVPRDKPDAQGPSLDLFDGGDAPRALRSYELSDPLSGLSTDPEGRFAVVYPSAADNSFVANPNELSIIDLTREPAADNPVPLTCAASAAARRASSSARSSRSLEARAGSSWCSPIATRASSISASPRRATSPFA